MGKLETSGKIRLNKYLANCGIASRRRSDSYITQGLVIVNGKRVYELGTKVDPNKDKITVNGKPIRLENKNIYLMFYKPRGVITSIGDPLDRPSVADYLPAMKYRVFPVGRLDWDSEGLLLLTNDGDFAQKVLHPESEIPRTYMAKLNAAPSEEKLKKLLLGVSIPGGKVSAENVEKLSYGSGEHPWYKITITEGKNRQVRRMFEKVGFDVLKLKRVAIGQLKIGNLNPGEIVELSAEKIQQVFRTIKMIEDRSRLKQRSKRQKSTKRSTSQSQNETAKALRTH